ncbi:MAG: MmcQ/YjbR family DNA-binding protein [Myxococcota bacterium]
MAAKKAAKKKKKKAARKKAAQRAPKKKTTRRASKKAPGRRTKSERLLDRARAIIAAWPETDERLSHGSPTWWGGKKTFATFHENHHGDGRIALWIKSDFDAQEGLVEANPDLFFVPPYVGPSGWIGVVLDRDVDWGVVAGLLEDGYRAVAPRRAIARLDGGQR